MVQWLFLYGSIASAFCYGKDETKGGKEVCKK